MEIKFYNCPEPEQFQSALSEVVQPPFLSYTPDWKFIERMQSECALFSDIVIVAHGGSINSFYGLYNALVDATSLRVHFLSTTDPDYIFQLKQKLSPDHTLIIAISKSGETVTQLEALTHFLQFKLMVITSPDTPLYDIGVRMNAQLVPHPPIGGRYTGMTEVALLPAALCGFNIKELFAGAQEYYRLFNEDNLAWRAASILWQLERDHNYFGVFMPFYSHYLFPFSQLIVQLCHESFGKGELGQAYFAHEGPESQHHTTQRFIGGRKNLAGFFVGQDSFNHDLSTLVPPSVQSVDFHNQKLDLLSGIPLSKSLEFELVGTMEDARIKGIPLLHLNVHGRNFIEMGRFLAFWQLYAVYGSLLRGVNAFDQPQVEAGKHISFTKRLEFKGLL